MKNSTLELCFQTIQKIIAITMVFVLFSFHGVKASPDEWSGNLEIDVFEEAWMTGAMSCKVSVQISLDQIGQAQVLPGMLVTGPQFPLSEYEVDIMGPLTDVVSCDDIGQEVMAVVEELPTGNTCMSTLIVKDKLKPLFECEGDSLPCNVLIDTINFENYIDVLVDNCDDDLDLFHTYTVTPVDCNPNNIVAFIKVDWTATDDFNNSSSCSDTIFLIKPGIDEVVFPNDTAISCVNADPSPEVIGGPTVLGGPIDHTCKLIAWHSDTHIPMCSGMTKILRLWSVMDWCTGVTRTAMQEILIEDNMPPVVVCPPNENYSTDVNGCFANYTLLPPVSVQDACSDPNLITIRIKSSSQPGVFQPGDVLQLPIGVHTITIEAIDDCQNKGVCSYTVTVVDNIPPTFVCSNLSIGIGANGVSTVMADTLDFNPMDNCAVDKVEIARMTDQCNNPDNLVFDNEITLCCEDVGDSILVLYKVSDIYGNMNTCMFGITVKDALPPVALCKDVTLSIENQNSVSVSANDIDNGSTDNCEVVSRMVNPNSFDCNDIGDQIVTLTVTDGSGNSSACSATVTIKDTQPPVAVCNNLTRTLGAMGMVTITAAEVDGGSTDNCAIDTIYISQDKFDCSDLGPNAVTLTVVDAFGNADDCISTVTIEELPPVANCKDVTVELDQNGDASITANDVNDNSDDDCGIDSLSVNPSAFNCSNFGDNSVTLTVTDNSGNSSTCTANVKVKDLLGPMCVTQDITVFLDDNGAASILSTDIDDGSSDNCSSLSFVVVPTDFDCSHIGDRTVTLTVTDIMGNMSDCSATVTVKDTISPTCNSDNITVYLDGNGDASVTASDINNNSSDNCSVASTAVNPNIFNCSNAGNSVQVVLTVMDGSGNSSTCTAQVSVLDTIPPVALCSDITIQVDGSGDATISVLDINNGSSDNCGISSLVLDNMTFNCADIGTSSVILTVTDINTNSATCQATITIEDNADPVAVCQNISVMLDGNGMASITAQEVDGGTSDNCGFTLSASPLNFNCDDVGPQNVQLIATDPSNNSDDCIAVVTVMENTLPTASCMNTTVYLDANGDASIVPADIDAGSGDNCSDVSLNVDPSTFDCDDEGSNMVTLTVTDAANNMASCTATVTVLDTTSPNALCVADFELMLDASGNATITVNSINNNSTDNCPVVTPSIDVSSFTCADLGQNIVTLTVIDGSTNQDECTTTITIVDDMAPIAVCEDITVSLGAGAMVTIVPGDIDGGTSDNCSFTLAASPLSFGCNDVGPNTVELIATDPSGNADTCEAQVIVDELVDLQAVCQNAMVTLDGDGNATITPADVDGGSISSCAVPDVTIDINSFDCGDIGSNQVVLTASSGNASDTCHATVTVVDNSDPNALCQNITIYLDGAGNATITPGDVDNGSNDNCPITTAIDVNTFDCGDTSQNNVILTVTDNSGNSATCLAVVTVLDTILPTCLTKDITISLDGNGNAMITVNDIDNGSTDNCSPITFGLTPTSFTCDNLGDNVVTLSPQDPTGNTSMCTATVTVIDESNLVANCQNTTVFLDGNGMASIDPDDIDTGSGGGCAGMGFDLALDITDFDCGDVGTVMVTLTVTDQQNNSATCTATVTVIDNMPPSITCPPNVQLNCNDVNDLSDLTQFGVPVADDNCGVNNVAEAIIIDLDNCGIGNIIRTFTAVDLSNNTVQCSQTLSIINPDPFSVNDIIPPPPSIDLFGCVSTDPQDIPNSQPSVILSPQSCSPFSIEYEDSNITTTVDNNPATECLSITRTWTIRDSCSLVDGTNNGIYTFVQVITVNDNVGPVFDPINDIVVTATANNCEVLVPLVVSATDCSNITYTNNSAFGATDGADASGMYPFGTTIVTFTATDECGNETTLDVSVTVQEDMPATFNCTKLIVDLPQELEITIHARDFVIFVAGSCSGLSDYFFSYTSGDPYDSIQVFDCGDVGVTSLDIFWYNEFGIKIDSCDFADLELRDDTDLCQDGFTVEGEVESEDGFAINDTEIMIEEMTMDPIMTTQTGGYLINGLASTGGYTVKPSRDYNDLEGVSTLDLVMMQKHLLGIRPLTSPYKMIAADANKSGRVTGIDLLEVRKLLLGIYSEFPHNESWRFIDAAFIFPDPYNPFMTEFPEEVHLGELYTPTTILNFIGVKIGDINGSYFSNFNEVSVETRDAQGFIQIQDQVLGDDWVEVPVRISDLEKCIGLQLDLRLDWHHIADWEIRDIHSMIQPDQINIYGGGMTLSWNDVKNVSFDENMTLFTIRVKGKNSNAHLSESVSINAGELEPEAYVEGNGYEIIPLEIEWVDVQNDKNEYALFQNVPNPFQNETSIGFSLPKTSDVLIQVFNANGQLLSEFEGQYPAGSHTLQVSQNIFQKSGVYYYSMKTSEFTASRKMVFNK